VMTLIRKHTQELQEMLPIAQLQKTLASGCPCGSSKYKRKSDKSHLLVPHRCVRLHLRGE
jgi:hypothetical protein